MKVLLLIATLVVSLGQLHAGPIPTSTSSTAILSSDARAVFFGEFTQLLDGIAKEALQSLSLLGQNTAGQLKSVEESIQQLETLYNEKVLNELAKYDGALEELQSKVSPCFEPAAENIREIVSQARGKAGQCAEDTLGRVKQIERNIEEHVNAALGKVQDILAIGAECLKKNSWIIDQINCALQNAPVAVRIVEEIVQDAASVIGQTSRDVAGLAASAEQCLAVVVDDAVTDFNNVLGEVVDCLGGADGQTLQIA